MPFHFSLYPAIHFYQLPPFFSFSLFISHPLSSFLCHTTCRGFSLHDLWVAQRDNTSRFDICRASDFVTGAYPGTGSIFGSQPVPRSCPFVHQTSSLGTFFMFCLLANLLCPILFLSFFVLLSVLLPLGYVKYFLNQSLLRRLTSAAGVDFRKRPIDDTAHTCEWVWTRVGSDLGNVNQENFQNVTGNTFLCSLMAK